MPALAHARESALHVILKVQNISLTRLGYRPSTRALQRAMVPSDAALEIEADIPAAENGYVHVGDKVAIKFATFPFTRYGLAHGTVRVISPDSFTAQEDERNPTGDVPTSAGSTEPYYRAHVSLDRVELRNTPPGFHLMPGMPTTADIKVGKRTVLTYLLERVLPVVYNGM
jgi:hemolysin D